jgi:predicted nucleic acid-binding protein
MKRVLIDTNIIVDIATRREPFFEHSSKILELAIEGKIIAYVSASAVTDIFYILQKENGKINTIQFLKDLFDYINILSVDKKIIINALNMNWEDFEDAVQGNVASYNSLDAIITRNTKDFVNLKSIQILDPFNFLANSNKF